MAAGEPGTESGRTKLESSRRVPSSGGFSMTISVRESGMPQTVSKNPPSTTLVHSSGGSRMTMWVRESGMPQTVSKNSPSTNVLPSTSRPSATKKPVTTSRSATVRPTWSKRRTCEIARPFLPSSYRPYIRHGGRSQYHSLRDLHKRTLSAACECVPIRARGQPPRAADGPAVGPTPARVASRASSRVLLIHQCGRRVDDQELGYLGLIDAHDGGCSLSGHR